MTGGDPLLLMALSYEGLYALLNEESPGDWKIGLDPNSLPAWRELVSGSCP